MTTVKSFPVIDFNQFGSEGQSDRLLLFAAPAKEIASWAGIPRKGWRIRMLFQRWITSGRENELKEFWKRASDPLEGYVLAPAAIVVAIQGNPIIKDGKIVLQYDSPIDDPDLTPAEQLKILATLIYPKVQNRLAEDLESISLIDAFACDPLVELPDIKHNYVLEFALQLIQMEKDPDWFICRNDIGEEDLASLIASMESLCRPALVVDGQHRLYGAADPLVSDDVFLPVVAMTNSDWVGEVYQFVVINEKAQKVDSELLNDIFASSLSPLEQDRMRQSFIKVKVDIEQRIAGVLAGRDLNSPFYQMVTLNLPNPPEAEKFAYISQNIIQCIINGGRGALGWRSDDNFFNWYVKPTYPNRKDWEDWKDGKWRNYWFAFWNEVRDFYRPLAKTKMGADFDIWSKEKLSNLTKGAGLKIFQRFFMEQVVKKMKEIKESLSILMEMGLDPEEIDRKIAEKVLEKSIPIELDDFRTRVREEFLKKFPVRFFTANWETSLDDTNGHDKLLVQMREAFERDNWRTVGGGVFVPSNS